MLLGCKTKTDEKYLLGAASLLVVAVAGIGGYAYYQEQQVDPLIKENLEAILQGETTVVQGPAETKMCPACTTYHTYCLGKKNGGFCAHTGH